MDPAHVRTPTPLDGNEPPTYGHVLVVEPDHLTLWSVATYLQHWFTVDSTNCAVEAQKLLRDHVVAAVIVSDQLPGQTADSLIRLAQSRNPQVRSVLLATGTGEPHGSTLCSTRIEKPFELAALARLLGVRVQPGGP